MYLKKTFLRINKVAFGCIQCDIALFKMLELTRYRYYNTKV